MQPVVKDPAHVVIISGILIVGLAGFVKFLILQSRARGKIIERGSRWVQHPYLTVAVGLPWMVSLYLSIKEVGSIDIGMMGNAVCSFIGLSLYVISIALWIWSAITLKYSFSFQVEVRETQEFICAGPYRYIRHPMYSSFIIMNMGIALSLRNLIHLFLTLFIILPALHLRAREEEMLLSRYFGEGYRDYIRSIPRFIPRIIRFRKGG